MSGGHRDRSMHIERACSADIMPSVNINQFNLNRFIDTEGLTSAEHALSMCILRSLCNVSTTQVKMAIKIRDALNGPLQP